LLAHPMIASQPREAVACARMPRVVLGICGALVGRAPS